VGDPTRLRQILINLTGNAIKFTKAGNVSVQAERLPARDESILIRFSVSDTGIGIPTEKQEQIFEAFSQADSSTTREFGGTGLGLSISARLIQLMHGQIQLESEPGKGSTFSFALPFSVGTVAATSPSVAVHAAMLGKKVLVVDDNEINRNLLMHILSQWGLQPACAANGSQALEIFEKARGTGAPFSLVLLDHAMPEMDGYEVARRIRLLAKKDRPGIIILSSAPSLSDPHHLKKLEIDGTLFKPLRRHALFDAIRQSLKLPADSVPAPHVRNDGGKCARGLRLLLVEDNAVNQKLALRLLEKMGHQVSCALNGREAVNAFNFATFDLILMDIQMPVMSGVEATQKIREAEQKTSGHVPIIAMTAHAMAGDEEKYLFAGMDGYVSKPVRPGFLRAEIDRLAGAGNNSASHPTQKEGKKMPNGIIDINELLARVENDRDLMRDLLQIFKEEFPQHLEALRKAVNSLDAETVAAEAHSMKGMLSNLAAGSAAAAAARIEKLGRNRAVSEFHEAFESLDRIGKELLLQLDVSMAEVCG